MTSTPRAQGLDRVDCGWPHRVGDGNQTDKLSAYRDVNDSSTRALQFLRLCAERAEVDSVLGHQPLVAEQRGLALHFGLRAFALDILEAGRLWCLYLFGPTQDCLRQRMVRAGVHAGRHGQQLILGGAVSRHEIDHLGLAHGQRAGLVENDDVELGRVLQCRGILEQDTVLRPEPGSDHDRHRGSKSERIGARDDEHRYH